jgi:hypothetical protein
MKQVARILDKVARESRVRPLFSMVVVGKVTYVLLSL